MLDTGRLDAEFAEMKRLAQKHPALRNFQLYRKTDASKNQWDSYFWEGAAPTGHTIKAYYPKRYPIERIMVKESPDIDTIHRIDGGLCLMRPEEWSPDWTAPAVILTAFRFLRDYAEGRVS